MKIKFITDSAADIPQKYAEEHEITIIPMSINFDTDSYEDGVNMTAEEFYAKLRKCTRLPKTNQINEYTFTEALKPYAGTDTLTVLITISSELSNTYNSAKAAAESLAADNLLVVDSSFASFAEGAFVIEAQKIAENGDFTKEELSEKLEDLKSRIKLYAMIDDLKYLKYGGRLSASSMFVANMLHIKPIVIIKKKVEVVSKQLGMTKAFRFMLDKLKSRDPDYPVYFGCSDCEEEAKRFMEKAVRENEGLKPFEYIADVGPTIGTHAGPGCIGLAFIEKK